jgi:hypothetical protein
MFDRHDVTHEYVVKERIEESLRKAARERAWERTPQPSALRHAIGQMGSALVSIGSRLQTPEQRQQIRRVT